MAPQRQRPPSGRVAPSIFRQHVDDRAGRVTVTRIALLDQTTQGLPHSGKIGHLLLDEVQLAHGQRPRLATGICCIQRQKCAHFVQRETQRLRPLDEAYPLGLFRCIAPMTAQWLDWLIQQAAPLLVADCFNIYTSRFRQLADGQFGRHQIPLDSVLRYGM